MKHALVIKAAGGGDIFTRIGNIANNSTEAMKLVGLAMITALFIVGAWRSKGALAGVITAFCGAAICWWALNHIGDSSITQQIDQTTKG